MARRLDRRDTAGKAIADNDHITALVEVAAIELHVTGGDLFVLHDLP